MGDRDLPAESVDFFDGEEPAVLIDHRLKIARLYSEKSPSPGNCSEVSEDLVQSPKSGIADACSPQAEQREPEPEVDVGTKRRLENDEIEEGSDAKRLKPSVETETSEDSSVSKSPKKGEFDLGNARVKQRRVHLELEPSSSKGNGGGKSKLTFRYGNYCQYYGKRNPGGAPDERMSHMNPEWFRGKCCLDVGCNIGHVTYSVARDFGPARIIGVDIDGHLVSVARKNLRHYLENSADVAGNSKGDRKEYDFVKPDARFRGPPKGDEKFPYNVGFVCGNYVGDDDTIVETSHAEFDTILCLSVSKWIHLNFGDEGLLRLFRRAFRQLKPGGRFIFEPQPWSSYNKAKKITPELRERYSVLLLRPENFPEILVRDVGFDRLDYLAWPEHDKPGFSRPIQIYYKASPAPAGSAE